MAEARNFTAANYALFFIGELGSRAQAALPTLRHVCRIADDTGTVPIRARAYEAFIKLAPDEAAGDQWNDAKAALARAHAYWAANKK